MSWLRLLCLCGAAAAAGDGGSGGGCPAGCALQYDGLFDCEPHSVSNLSQLLACPGAADATDVEIKRQDITAVGPADLGLFASAVSVDISFNNDLEEFDADAFLALPALERIYVGHNPGLFELPEETLDRLYGVTEVDLAMNDMSAYRTASRNLCDRVQRGELHWHGNPIVQDFSR